MAIRIARSAYIAYVSMRQHTSAYVSIRQHTSAILGGVHLGDTHSRERLYMYECIYIYIYLKRLSELGPHSEHLVLALRVRFVEEEEHCL